MSETLSLAIDASTYVGTVALVRGTTVLAEREAAMRGEREERLMPAVADALRAAGAGAGAVGRVVCGAGPGSFTSLRIAASIAKGLSLAHGVPLFAVSSLALMTPKRGAFGQEGRWLAVLDAMRGDFHAQLLRTDGSGRIVELLAPELVPRDELAPRAARHDAVLVGEGMEVPGAPRAAAVALAAAPWVREVSLATWEPAYGRLAEAQVKWEAAHGRALAPG